MGICLNDYRNRSVRVFPVRPRPIRVATYCRFQRIHWMHRTNSPKQSI